jgi:hypothetical protein
MSGGAALRLLIWTAIVAIAHVASSLLLYPCGVVSPEAAILGPALLATGCYLLVAWRSTPAIASVFVRWAIVSAIAVVATMVSFTCAGIVVFNRYGS